MITITQIINSYISKINVKNLEEVDELILKLSEQRTKLDIQVNSTLKLYFFVFVIYSLLHVFKINQIELVGIVINESSIFKPFFLIISSYLLYRLMSLSVLRGFILKLYFELRKKSSKTYYKVNLDLFLSEYTEGITEEIIYLNTSKDNKLFYFFHKIYRALAIISTIILCLVVLNETIELCYMSEFHNYVLYLDIFSILIFSIFAIITMKNITNGYNFEK